MRKSRYSDQQIALALLELAKGQTTVEAARKLGITEQTYYR
ncbi:MAG: transposase, partial [Gammaproteobacteria bacterium]|nr:transposase [Gammaproteobacteria bacterium]